LNSIITVTPCDRHFQNDNNLRQRLNSSTHRPRNTHCPAGCGSSFISKSALVHHLESGDCSSGNAVNRVVRQLDTNHVITDPSRLITGGTSVDDEATYYATAFSWNGSAYECYPCHKDNSSLTSLNQHLASPTHRKSYICPGPNCETHFVGLGALCQHTESQSCGVLRFRAVQATMNSLLPNPVSANLLSMKDPDVRYHRASRSTTNITTRWSGSITYKAILSSHPDLGGGHRMLWLLA